MPASPPSILMILTWFGAWPGWLRFFLESCRRNPTIDWAIWTDQSAPHDLPPNVRVSTLSFDAYRDLVARRLGLRLAGFTAMSARLTIIGASAIST
jgi:hypothetical protein